MGDSLAASAKDVSTDDEKTAEVDSRSSSPSLPGSAGASVTEEPVAPAAPVNVPTTQAGEKQAPNRRRGGGRNRTYFHKPKGPANRQPRGTRFRKKKTNHSNNRYNQNLSHNRRKFVRQRATEKGYCFKFQS